MRYFFCVYISRFMNISYIMSFFSITAINFTWSTFFIQYNLSVFSFNCLSFSTETITRAWSNKKTARNRNITTKILHSYCVSPLTASPPTAAVLRREQLHRLPAGDAVAEQQVKQRRDARSVLQTGGRPAELPAQGPVVPLAAQPGELVLPHSGYPFLCLWSNLEKKPFVLIVL